MSLPRERLEPPRVSTRAGRRAEQLGVEGLRRRFAVAVGVALATLLVLVTVLLALT
jgi:hypothetical protein